MAPIGYARILALAAMEVWESVAARAAGWIGVVADVERHRSTPDCQMMAISSATPIGKRGSVVIA